MQDIRRIFRHSNRTIKLHDRPHHLQILFWVRSSQLMEQMSKMNSRVDEIQDFIKTNIPTSTDNKKGKQVSFSDQLPSQAIINPRNQGSSSSQTHNLSHVHVDEEAVEAALAISSLRSGKDLPDPYKDHPLHKSSIDDETLTTVVEPGQ